MAISPDPAELNAYWLEYTCTREGFPSPGRPLLQLEGLEPAAAARLGRLLAEAGGECLPAPRPAGAVRLAGGRVPLGRLAARLRREAPELAAAAAAVEECLAPRRRELRVGSRVLDFSRRTHVMGILNVTPDSFFPGSRVEDLGPAVERAIEMEAAGADLLDVGGESTRPGAAPVDPQEEARRVVPLIREIRRRSQVPLSVDTRHAAVARQALEAGADLLNDISGLSHDPGMAALAAESGAPVVLMHMRGEPRTMQQHAQYGDTVGEVIRELRAAVRTALEAGIDPQRIVVDPGIGFAKGAEDNLRLLARLPSLGSLGFPLLVGLSRKSFLGQVTGRPVEGRLAATVAAHVLAVLGGADILRVHDVAEAVEAVKVVGAVRGAEG